MIDLMRRQISDGAERREESNLQKPSVEIAMTVWNPVVVPNSIAPRASCTARVRSTAFTGTWVLLSTLLKNLEKGRPLSLAKASAARDPSARMLFPATITMTEIKLDKITVAALFPVES